MNNVDFLSAKSSKERLEKLIVQRLEKDSNKEQIDKRVWDLFGEKWCVMFTDLSGFSRGVEKFGIIHFLQIIIESERILLPIIDEFDGILIKTEGDSLLVIFRNLDKALMCSIKMHKVLQQYNIDKEEEEKILLCLGLGYGNILNIGFSDVFGAEVNAASKLGEDTAKPWEILVTQSVKDNLTIKNISFQKIEEKIPGTNEAYKVFF